MWVKPVIILRVGWFSLCIEHDAIRTSAQSVIQECNTNMAILLQDQLSQREVVMCSYVWSDVYYLYDKTGLCKGL